MFKKLAGLLVTMSVLSVSPTGAMADFTDAEKSDLNALFESYIKANPAVVREALIALADQEAEEQRLQALALLRADNGDPFMGAGDDADIVIYEFSDYNCGYCKRVFTQLQAVLADDPKVRLTLKEFPILAETSLEAARAAIAAHKQGMFEPFHIGMMTWRGAISTNSILSVAAEAGLDITRLEADMKSGDIDAILARTRASAQALDVSGTPALMIGDEFVGGAVSAEQIRAIIAEQRAKKAS